VKHLATITAAFLAGVALGALAVVLAPELVALTGWRPRVSLI
jgi:hypothetical protein